MWLLLFAAQLVTLALLAATGSATAATPALRYLGYVCLAGIFVCMPPILVKLFVAGQTRIGNADHGMVRGLQQHETPTILAFWAVIVVALIMALPRIRQDLRAEAAATAVPAVSPEPGVKDQIRALDTIDVIGPVTTPAPGSAERTAILDAVRQRVQTTNHFRVDHIRMARNWAFVRATEVVALDAGEEQETDLTVAALLELPDDSPTGWWRIVDYWTLPGEAERPFASFVRHMVERRRSQRLPGSLFPDDIWEH